MSKDSSMVVFAGPHHPEYKNKEASMWTLKSPINSKNQKSKESQSHFYIELNYQNLEKRPRLIADVESPYFFSKCKATYLEEHGYSNDGQSLWSIEKIFNENEFVLFESFHRSHSMVSNGAFNDFM